MKQTRFIFVHHKINSSSRLIWFMCRSIKVIDNPNEVMNLIGDMLRQKYRPVTTR